MLSEKKAASQKKFIHLTVERIEQKTLLYKDKRILITRKSRIYDAIQTHQYKLKLIQSIKSSQKEVRMFIVQKKGLGHFNSNYSS